MVAKASYEKFARVIKVVKVIPKVIPTYSQRALIKVANPWKSGSKVTSALLAP
jgi:hypothetical protein